MQTSEDEALNVNIILALLKEMLKLCYLYTMEYHLAIKNENFA